MNEFVQCVRAAATAGWWTILIAAGWLTLAWLIAMPLIRSRPAWMLRMLGGGNFSWDDLQKMYLWAFTGFKAVFFVALVLVIWLTIWSRSLPTT